MRAAFFTPYLPYPPDTGGKIRSYHLVRALGNKLDVDLYTVHHGEEGPQAAHETALRQFCRQVKSYRLDKDWSPRGRLATLLQPLPRSVAYFCTAQSLLWAGRDISDRAYDLVVCDEISMAPYAELARHEPRLVLRQKVDHLHYRDMAGARGWGVAKLLDLIESSKLARYERQKMPLFSGYVACSAEDASAIARDAGNVPGRIIPNGADLTEFVNTECPVREPKTLLFVGSMNYYPNVDAILYFFDDIYSVIRKQVPQLRVQIVGHSPSPEVMRLRSLPGVEVTGTVPDVRPYYCTATVFLVPLRLGRGTRLKIIEAMAMGIPVVSTRVGAEGLEVHDGEDILIADDAASFAGAALRLLEDAALREKISQGGKDLARRYDWSELTKPFVDLARQIVKDRNRRTGN